MHCNDATFTMILNHLCHIWSPRLWTTLRCHKSPTLGLGLQACLDVELSSQLTKCIQMKSFYIFLNSNSCQYKRRHSKICYCDFFPLCLSSSINELDMDICQTSSYSIIAIFSVLIPSWLFSAVQAAPTFYSQCPRFRPSPAYNPPCTRPNPACHPSLHAGH